MKPFVDNTPLSWWEECSPEGFTAVCRREFMLREPIRTKRDPLDDLEALATSILTLLEAEEPED